MIYQKSPTHLASAEFSAIVLLILGLGLSLSLSVLADSTDNPEEVELPNPDIFSWKALPNLGDYTALCYQDDNGGLVCHDSCPEGAICAEFSNHYGVTYTYCCIPPEVVGSTELSDCMMEVRLVRNGPPEEIFSPPWR